LHELIDMDGGVIVGIEFETYIGDCVYESDSVLIEIQ